MRSQSTNPTLARSGTARKASALIVVLWVLGLLSMLIGSFAFDAHIEARITSYYRKRMKAEALAASGIEVARMLLEKRSQIPEGQEEPEDETDRWFEHANRIKKGSIRGLKEKLGEGTITLDIVPEPARRNINNLDLRGNDTKNYDTVAQQLEQILRVGGLTDDRQIAQLVDSFLDWIDEDNEPRMDGAETEDYYARLPEPYAAKNSRTLDTVEELLLVKGFDRTILFGGELKAAFAGEEPKRITGIVNLLTTYGDGRVNINAADQQVLLTLPGVEEIVAGAIVEQREGEVDVDGKRKEKYYKGQGDLPQEAQQLTDMLPYLNFGVGGVFRITSVGTVHGVSREVWCIAQYDRADQPLKIFRWREQD